MSCAEKVVLGLTGLLLVALTAQQEHSSRFHWDSLRVERRIRTSVLWIPVWSHKRAPSDSFPGVYAEITGKPADSRRWKQWHADFVSSVWSATFLCYDNGMEEKERRELLTAVFERYQAGVSRRQTAGEILRIDALIPAPTSSQRDMDFLALDALRTEVGLKTHLSP